VTYLLMKRVQKIIEPTNELHLAASSQVFSAAAKTKNRPIKLALVSCGLGHINRGVEVSTARWYEALKDNDALDVRLFSGDKYPGAISVFNFPRDWLLAKVFFPLTRYNKRRIWELAYGIEQISHGIFLGPKLLKWKPDVVWTKEAPFAHFLLFHRKLFGLKYKIVFANGCGFKPETYTYFDHIQHLHQQSFLEAANSGIPESKMTVLPNFTPKPVLNKTKEECRNYFGYKPNDWVVCCVAAWNRYHKRIDYLLEEVAKLNDQNIKVLLCGHPEPDVDDLKALAEKLLPGRVQWHTLPANQVSMALNAADVFVLPSVNELFGGVLIEALMLGLPVIAHHTAASQQLNDLQFKTYDLSGPGDLANHLTALRQTPPQKADLDRLANDMQRLFSQDELCQQFITMLKTMITNAGKSRKPAMPK
jgi:glycosyltransferase involved in cell wall biosynthesis